MMNKLTPNSNMRWESSRMILPEYREAWLQEREGRKKVEQPMLDEQQWLEFEFTLSEAMTYNRRVVFTYYNEGEFHEVEGHCDYLNHAQKQFHIVSATEDVHYVKFHSLVHVELCS